jgi:anthranilate phosphoribosyltransferase
MNLLGPLTNPAGVTRQLVGVSDPSWLELIAPALRELGHQRALVVHGEPGMDELSPAGTTTVSDLRGGSITTYPVTPADLGLERGSLEALAGGTPRENATVIVDVLEGRRRDSARSFVLANAAAAVYVANLADSLPEGVAMAAEAIDRGLAIRKLAELREASRAGGE